MAWIDYQKAYDMVPHSWILECARMVGVAQNIINVIENSMDREQHGKMEDSVDRRYLGW